MEEDEKVDLLSDVGMVTGKQQRAPRQGDLVTPTGRLILPPGKLGSEEWLEFRRLRAEVPGKYCIGSSDVPSILDLDGVGTPAHVYRAKVMNIHPEVTEQMQLGHVFEQPIAMEWCRRNRAVIDELGLVSHMGRPWHQCTIDRRVRECPVWPDRKGECGLEVKKVDFVSPRRWHTPSGIPDRVWAQIIHQLYVTGYQHMHYACAVPGRIVQGVVHRDRDGVPEVMDFIVAEVERFRNEHLIPEIEPPWNFDGKADKMIELDKATYGERIGELDLDGIGEVMDYARLQRTAADAGKDQDRAAARLRQLATGHKVMKFSGERAYWYGEGSRTNVDLERLAERWPDAYADCVSEKTFPVLHIDKAYKIKGEK